MESIANEMRRIAGLIDSAIEAGEDEHVWAMIPGLIDAANLPCRFADPDRPDPTPYIDSRDVQYALERIADSLVSRWETSWNEDVATRWLEWRLSQEWWASPEFKDLGPLKPASQQSAHTDG